MIGQETQRQPAWILPAPIRACASAAAEAHAAAARGNLSHRRPGQ